MLKIDSDTLKQRVQTVERGLRARGVEALVLYATGSVLGNQSLTHSYLRYLCNFDGHNAPALLLLLLTGTKFHMRARLAVLTNKHAFVRLEFPVAPRKFPVPRDKFPVNLLRELLEKSLQHSSFLLPNPLRRPENRKFPC